ncbi:Plakophilin-1 [Anabarilius grahami]|uniref:Plakophilin-1 n=1 Tax=Anabarilius grahami TaxID=495550 RepID=A0A3N0YF20_ANAGA|nr:Plakophilin-1 [Anabarilius grahami]
MLYSANSGLQKTAMSLVGNMSRVSSLRSTMAKEVLPTVSSVLSAWNLKMVKSDSSIATACRVMHTLMLADPESGKKVLNSKLINSLSMLSTNMSLETARKAAAVLLFSMWGQKDIQNGLKKATCNPCFSNLLPVKVHWNGSQTHDFPPVNSYQIDVLPVTSSDVT